MIKQQQHPYYPITLDIPQYVPNDKSTFQILLIAGNIMSFIVVLCYAISRQKTVTSFLRFTWFVVCGILHLGFEGYWLFHKNTIAGQNDLLAQLWKEYAHGDSRYMIADHLLTTLETMTIFIWGPVCLISAFYIWRGSPKQYFFQLIASLFHMFSCSLYFADLPNAIYCDPNPIYFWVYFVGFNSPWIIVCNDKKNSFPHNLSIL
ncbi:Emopamil binding protein-domain-containing protein [Cokeromyces recurvatus]|uniref:Emopamil binding protein-domain-containing protein n=1 Tax=Cokeromyces recurvatus TaxID=90255 RepID=UPI0022201825|nr:Emopamil binding protein-domain-containing protein [Cokeromyces recurvatus]KAI7900238.1 Emopamil binding protein-domain-containing protein [Cokeromyces recurvatus]